MKTMVAVAGLVIASTAAAGPAGNLPAATPAGKSFIIHRQLEATVSNVDQAARVLLLRTDHGRLTLGAPADAMTLLHKGDRVIVDVAVLRHPDPTRIPREHTAPRPFLTRRLPADVTAVQRTFGTVSLKTAAGRLDVDLPLEAVGDLRTGDRLLVELSVLPESQAAALPRMEEQKRRAGLGALILRLFGGGRTEQQPRQ